MLETWLSIIYKWQCQEPIQTLTLVLMSDGTMSYYLERYFWIIGKMSPNLKSSYICYCLKACILYFPLIIISWEFWQESKGDICIRLDLLLFLRSGWINLKFRSNAFHLFLSWFLFSADLNPNISIELRIGAACHRISRIVKCGSTVRWY